MRILVSHVSPTPAKLTGITTYSWRILEALIRNGRHEYVLATNLSRSTLPTSLLDTGLTIVQRTLPANELRVMAMNQLDLPRLKHKVGASLMFHTQPTAMIGSMADSVVVIHDLYRVTNPEFYNRIQRLQWQHCVARGFRKAGHIIAVSGATRDAVVAAYPDLTDRMTVVHEASHIDDDKVVAPSADSTPSPAPFVLAVANITHNKNIGMLFEALHILEERGCRPTTVIIGRDEINVLPALMARFPMLHIELKQGLTNREVRDHYRHASVFVNMSLVEGFCLPVLEAQANRAPVICADIPVLREVAGDGALFVDPRAPADIANALSRVLTDSVVANDLRDRAYANSTRFSWEKAAVETEAVFDRLLADLGR